MSNYLAFLSYNSGDHATVTEIHQALENIYSISSFLDKWDITPGDLWQERLEAGLKRAKVGVVFIGPNGLGAWQKEEIYALLDLRVSDPGSRRVIPVILPGVQGVDSTTLPVFLKRNSWLDLRDGVTEEGLARLATAITGQRRTAPTPAKRPALQKVNLGIKADRIVNTIENVRGWVERSQNLDGGLPSDAIGSPSCTWTSAGLLWAMWASGSSFDEQWMRRALAWILDNRNEDLGIPVVIKGDHSIVDATAQTIIALSAANADLGRCDPRALSLINWLLDHQDTSAGWSWRPGVETSWTASTSFALLALRSALTIPGAPIDAIDASAQSALAWLRETRNHDGGWGSKRGDRTRVSVTGLAMHAISAFGLHDEALQAKSSLTAGYEEAHEWLDALDRPTGHTVTRWGAPYVLIGICAAFEPRDVGAIRGLIREVMRSYKEGHFQYRDSVMHTWPTRDALLALSSVLRLMGADDLARPWNGLPGSSEKRK